MPRDPDVLERLHESRVGRRLEKPSQPDAVTGDQGIAEGPDRGLEILGDGPLLARMLETDELPRVV